MGIQILLIYIVDLTNKISSSPMSMLFFCSFPSKMYFYFNKCLIYQFGINRVKHQTTLVTSKSKKTAYAVNLLYNFQTKCMPLVKLNEIQQYKKRLKIHPPAIVLYCYLQMIKPSVMILIGTFHNTLYHYYYSL